MQSPGVNSGDERFLMDLRSFQETIRLQHLSLMNSALFFRRGDRKRENEVIRNF
jgi:hypothetical protein